MKERPILFNAPMVRAIMDGRKTQTRREVKLRDLLKIRRGDATHYKDVSPDAAIKRCITDVGMDGLLKLCPYGQPGDQLWVRETFCPIYPQDASYNNGEPIEYDYAATYKHGDRLGDSIGIKKKWTPSIYMPRWASRIQLEITGIRVERLQDISEEDCIAEGTSDHRKMLIRLFDNKNITMKDAYRNLWESINGLGSWNANPWVWVIEFRRIKP